MLWHGQGNTLLVHRNCFSLLGSFDIFSKQGNDLWVDKFLWSSRGIAFICMQSNTAVPCTLIPDIRKKKKGLNCVEKQRRKTEYSTFLPQMKAFFYSRQGWACVLTHKKNKVFCCFLEKPELRKPCYLLHVWMV